MALYDKLLMENGAVQSVLRASKKARLTCNILSKHVAMDFRFIIKSK
jgi:hypothetical protein